MNETIITKAKTTGKITVFRIDGREIARIQQGRPGLHQPAFHSIIGTKWADHKCYHAAEKHIENVLSNLYATCGVRFIEV